MPGLLYLVWAAFLVRGFFYAGALPLWEGFDEYAHFAYVEQIVRGEQFLVDRTQTVPADVALSLTVAPLPWELRKSAGSARTLEAFWKLPPPERAAQLEQLRSLTPQSALAQKGGEALIYGALQPPLYYWLAALPYAVIRERPLLESVLVLRGFSVVIASLLVPLVFFAARRAFESGAAIGIAAVVALLPELYFDIARVGNECLGVVLFTALFVLCSGRDRLDLPWRQVIAIGLVLGLGLLTKAYFLTALPPLLMCTAPWNSGRQARRVAVSFAIAFALSGWWFVLNKVRTGTWTGLNEAVMVKGLTPLDTLHGIAHVDWRTAIDSIVLSHIWFGGWSSLQARSWVYHIYMGFALAGIAGVILGIKRLRAVAIPAVYFYLWFWAGQLYNVLLLFLSKGASTSMGWYLYAVVGAEVILLTQGWSLWVGAKFTKWVAPALAFMAGLLDLYTLHVVALPYYAGLIVHRDDGSLANLKLVDLRALGWRDAVERLCATKPEWLSSFSVTAVWAAFLLATLGLMVIPIWATSIPSIFHRREDVLAK